MENILLGLFAFVLAILFGFLISQFLSLMVVRLLGIPEMIFISIQLSSIETLALYFLVIYVLVLCNLLRRFRKMNVHAVLYLEKQNEKKMFQSSKKRNLVFICSALLGAFALLLWNSRCTMETMGAQETPQYLMLSVVLLVLSIYGICATSADLLLSMLLKRKHLAYQGDHLFVTRTFASKARTMSFTFGTLSMLILFSFLCLNVSSISKGIYHTSIELESPYDVQILDDKQSFSAYEQVIEETYTIDQTIEYDIFEEPAHQIQQYVNLQFYDYDPVIKLSEFNALRKLRNTEPITLDEEYYVVMNKQLYQQIKDQMKMEPYVVSSGKTLAFKAVDTEFFWYSMCNSGWFMIVVPDAYTQGLTLSESHLVVDTNEETSAQLLEDIKHAMAHRLTKVQEDGNITNEYYRLSVRGATIEEQNTLTAIMASVCLYIAFILISVVGTIFAVQSLSDAAKYRYRYQTLHRLGVSEHALNKTIRKQLLILFGLPVGYALIAAFCMLTSINRIYQILLDTSYTYLLYFASSMVVFFLIYGIYFIVTYIGFKRNVYEES